LQIKTMLKLSMVMVFGLCLVAGSTIAQAQEDQESDTRQIQISSSSPATEAIKIYPNRGVSINYAGAGQAIETIWLDNKSRILLTTDGCLRNLNPKCARNSASIIHLTRLESTPYKKKSNTSLMTVVTLNGQGKRYTYRYALQALDGKPTGASPTLIEYTVPGVNVNQLTAKRVATASPRVLGLRLRSGAARAEREGLLTDKELKKRTYQFILLVERGVPPSEAADRAGISRDFANTIYKLNQL
jgi:hypothetical protein